MIPKIIWQTYKSVDLPREAAECQDTWLRKNPGYVYNFFDDAAIYAFIREHFGGRLYSVFRASPLGVMRADIWRYAVLWVHGGIYADIDAVCHRPIDVWLDQSREAMVGLENDDDFCQWAFAVAPRHAFFGRVLEMIVERAMTTGIDTSHEDFVHRHTGPTIWREAVAECMGMPGADALSVFRRYQYEPRPPHGSVLLPQEFFGGLNVENLYGSLDFGEDYDRWVYRRDRLPKQIIRIPTEDGE
jgi:inositol phosphorylceramide mannosyltransferase catalytic subunit